jgi:hypothetical protein
VITGSAGPGWPNGRCRLPYARGLITVNVRARGPDGHGEDHPL